LELVWGGSETMQSKELQKSWKNSSEKLKLFESFEKAQKNRHHLRTSPNPK
jgi:hypothetical protein